MLIDPRRRGHPHFLVLSQTCLKLGVVFWDYLGARIGLAGAPAVAPLADIIRCRGQPA